MHTLNFILTSSISKNKHLAYLYGSELYYFNNLALEPSLNLISNKSQDSCLFVNNITTILRSNNAISVPNNVYIWNSRLDHANPGVIHSILDLYSIH